MMEDLRSLTAEETGCGSRAGTRWISELRWTGLALLAALVVSLGRQHSFLPPDGERETSSQWRPPPLDRRSGDQRPGSRQPGLGGALPGLLLPEAG